MSQLQTLFHSVCSYHVIFAFLYTCKGRVWDPSLDCHGRPRLLLVTLSSADTANDVIRAATKLRRSTDNHTRDNIFINRDLTPEQRAFDYELRKDLKRRRAAGEQNLVIRNGKVCEKQARPAAAAAR
jgi:hypothetical protein